MRCSPAVSATTPSEPGVVARPSRWPTGVLLGAALLLGTGACSVVTAPAPDSPTAPARSAAAVPAPTESLLAEVPDPHSAVGGLAPGFPVTLLPVPEGADVLVSVATPTEDPAVLDVSLNLRSGQEAADLVEHFRVTLLGAGFVETAPAQVEPGLSQQSTFSRADGAEIVVIGVLDRDGSRTLTLGGRVRPS